MRDSDSDTVIEGLPPGEGGSGGTTEDGSLGLVRQAMVAGGWRKCPTCEGRGSLRVIKPFPLRDSGVIWSDAECPDCVLGLAPGEASIDAVARNRWESQGMSWEELEAEERVASRNRSRRDLIAGRRAEVAFARMEMEFADDEIDGDFYGDIDEEGGENSAEGGRDRGDGWMVLEGETEL